MASTGVSSAVSGGGRGGRSSPQLLWRPLARRVGFQCNRAPLLRPFVNGRAEGNPDLSFSFSRICSLIRNNGRNTNAAGTSASPPYEGGRSAEWMAAAACECASRVADSHGVDAQGGGPEEAGADDNAPYDFRKSFKKVGHKRRYQPTLPNNDLD